MRQRKKRKTISKKKSNSILLIQYSVFGLAAAAVVGGVIYARKRKEKGLPILPFPTQPSAPPTGYPLPKNQPSAGTRKPLYVQNSFPLRQYMKGELVRALQQALVARGQRIAVDGYYGPKTAQALSAAGIPSPVSKSAFDSLVASPSNRIASASSSNSANTTPQADSPSESVADNAKNLLVSASVDGEVENTYFKTRPYAFAKKMTKVFTEPINRSKEITRIKAGDYIGKHLGKSIDITVNGSKVRFARVRLRADKFPNKEGWVWSGTIQSRTSGPGVSGVYGLLNGVIATAPTIMTDHENRQVEVLPNTLLGEAIGLQNGMVKVETKDGSHWRVSRADVQLV